MIFCIYYEMSTKYGQYYENIVDYSGLVDF